VFWFGLTYALMCVCVRVCVCVCVCVAGVGDAALFAQLGDEDLPSDSDDDDPDFKP